MNRRGFTLIELLIVVGIISILAAIATVNFLEAQERAQKASNSGNFKAIAVALQTYYTDYGKLPPADSVAGPFESHRPTDTSIGNGPAAGGSWDGVPWILITRGYISDQKTLFNQRYTRLYSGRETIGGGQPRFHNFRYAYNSAALSRGYHAGGNGNIESGTVWILRDLWLPADRGWHGASAPGYPGDYEYPWRDEKGDRTVEHVMYADFSVRLVRGGTNEEWRP